MRVAVGRGSGREFVLHVHVERVAGVAVGARVVVEDVGDDPVGEDVAETQRLAGSGEKFVDARGAISWFAGDDAERGVAAEAAGQIAEEGGAGAVVGEAAALPVGQRRLGVSFEAPDGGDGTADQAGRVFGEAFVDPGFLAEVVLCVDEMLELVGEDDVKGLAADPQAAVHIHHLRLVAERADGLEEDVVAGEVAAGAAAEVGLQDDDARIAVHAGNIGRP